MKVRIVTSLLAVTLLAVLALGSAGTGSAKLAAEPATTAATPFKVALVVEHCRAQRGQELDESLLVAPETQPELDDEDGVFDPDEDPLLDRAIEIVVQAQTASTSLLQRRLRVGYTRAGRLIDMLERRGIISGYEGSKPRRVLVDENDLQRVLAG